LKSSGIFSTASKANSGRIDFNFALVRNLGGREGYIPFSLTAASESNDDISVSSIVYEGSLESQLNFFPFNSFADIVRIVNEDLSGNRLFVPYIRVKIAGQYVRYVKSLVGSDSRIEGTAKWSIPILDNQTFVNFCGTARYLVESKKTRAFLAGELEYKISSQVGVLVKYLDGAQPPTFEYTHAVLAGINLLLDRQATDGGR
jgi:hypothetical protein